MEIKLTYNEAIKFMQWFQTSYFTNSDNKFSAVFLYKLNINALRIQNMIKNLGNKTNEDNQLTNEILNESETIEIYKIGINELENVSCDYTSLAQIAFMIGD